MAVSSNTHIISTFTLEIVSTKVQEVQQLQSMLSQILQEQLLPNLGKDLDELSKGQHIRIEKLLLSIPIMRFQHAEKELPQLIRQELRSEISRLLRVQGQSNGEHHEDAILFYLRNGYWPWWSTVMDVQAWQQQLRQAMTDANKSELLKQFKTLLVSHAYARQRLVYLTSNNFLQQLVRTIGDNKITECCSRMLRVSNYLPAALGGRNARNILFINALQSTGSRQKEIDKYFFSAVTADWLKNQDRYDAYSLQQYLKNKLSLLATKDRQTAAWLDKMLSGGLPASTPPDIKNNEPEVFVEVKEEVANNLLEGMFIDNAGLVLLHPFLEALFKSQGWLKGKQFKNEQSRHLAILLLEYLSTGDTRPKDGELLLNKLLCGQALQLPVDTGLRLKKSSLKAADQILESVITHWSKLKNTSPAGLRNSFIRRKAKLTQKETRDWKMRVERKTEDVLLSDIPWSYGIIKLSWMPKMLWVEW